MLAICLVVAAAAAPPALPTPLRSWRADLAEPARLALDADGGLFITDPTRGEIVHRAADGRLLDRQGGFERPVGVAVATTGHVLVGDAEAGTVTAYDADWTQAFSVGEGFAFPSDIAVEPATGRILVADMDRVQVLDADGLHLFDIGGFGFAASVWSTGERIVVVDESTWQVRAFDADGVEEWAFGEWGTDDGELFKPLGVTTDAEGRIYVAEARDAEIEIFDGEGVWLGAVGGLGERAGLLRTPTDLVIDPWGRLLVASSNNARVEMYALEGATDPEAWVPGVALVRPGSLSRNTGVVEVSVELPGYRPAWASDVTVNGSAVEWASGDLDGDRLAEVVATLDAGALFDGEGERRTLTIAGTVTPPGGTPLAFAEDAVVWLVPEDQPDTGEPADTDEPGDTAGVEDTGAEDTSAPSPAEPIAGSDPGCGCGGGASGAGLLLLPWLALRRRRS